MVHFKEDRFLIEIETGSNPIADWMKLHEQLCFLIKNSEMQADQFWMVSNLLDGMMPDFDTARKMV